jgi:hypothetical protein
MHYINIIRVEKLTIILLLLLFGLKANPQKIDLITRQGAIHVLYEGKERISGGVPIFQGSPPGAPSIIQSVEKDSVLLLSIRADNQRFIKGDEFVGVFFDKINDYQTGISLWRYGPYLSWTKPIRIDPLGQMAESDIQFYYWKHSDGLYGAAVPLSGNGYRSTLGNDNYRWGCKALTYKSHYQDKDIPCIAIAFGENPFELFSRIYRVALESMGKGENIQAKKILPEPFNYIGWCSWNSSNYGKKLNEDLLIDAAKSFCENNFPLGWILIDDGWIQHRELMLTSLEPPKEKFPNGFHMVVDNLKKDFRIKYIGVWHTINGYWHGIDSISELGKRYRSEMFSWKHKENTEIKDSLLCPFYFIRPESDSLLAFYESWHKYFRSQGIDFVKVDYQLITELMAIGNYPVFQFSESIYEAMNKSVKDNFDNAIIHCMDMTPQAYLNFGETAVARCVEDYVPYKPEENYNLVHGNAAAHIVQALYNSIYFSQMVFPDLDMFQSHNPNAVFHAIARALNNGPIYITDNVGKQNFDVLTPLIYADGKIIRSQTSLLPTEDCLFTVQDEVPFKAFSKVGNKGLLAVWNAADADKVAGHIKVADINEINGKDFLLYEYFSNKVRMIRRETKINIELLRMGFKLFYVIPVTDGFAAIGLTNKYNAPATILAENKNGRSVKVKVYEGGTFKAFVETKPKQIKVDGELIFEFRYLDQILILDVLQKNSGVHPEIEILW